MTPAADWREAHRRAIERGESTYIDPDTGFQVFTELGLERRGHCCGSGCRHCPYQHESMELDSRVAGAQQPSWLTGAAPPGEPADVLFWSGGKDSFLCYRVLMREAVRPVALLTTFDAASRIVAHQEIGVRQVVRQAEHLGLPLLGVPLHPGHDYVDRIREAVSLVPAIVRFVFGDLHLRHIREWRDTAFRELAAECGATLHFPLWGVSAETLIADLEASGVPCVVSAVTEAAEGVVEVGDEFGREMMERLPDSVDPFGENGEFHTLAMVWRKTAIPARIPCTSAPPVEAGRARTYEEKTPK